MKKLKLFFALFAMLALGVGNAWAEEELYKTALFGSSYNSKKVSSYTDTWTATNNGFTVTVVNANNNNNGWAYIKMGRKSYTSVGSITTQAAIDKPISKVTMTIDAVTAKNINSIKLKTSTDGSSFVEVGNFTISTGEQSVTINNPTANLYYQIEVDCKTGSNGSIQISKVQYYATEDAGTEETVVSVPTFSVPEGTFYSPINVELSCSTADAEIHYTLDGSTPSSTSEKYTTAIAISETTTIKAIAIKDGLTDSEVATATYTKGETITSYDIDFETNALEAYVNWDFSNITITTATIQAKAGTYYANTSGKASASIKTKEVIQYPGILTFYTSKESGNTTSSSWKVQVSENGTNWTDVQSFDATTGNKGDWTEHTADLSDYENVYVQISYSGSTAIRAIDEISLAQGVAPVKYTLTIENPENGTLSVTKGGVSVVSGEQFKAGTSLVVTPTPASGYLFESLTVDGSAVELTDGTYTFTMPAADVTIAATFKANEKPAATLTLSKNGVEETFSGSWKQDDVVTLPSITSDCVKAFVGWSADDKCATEPEYKAGEEYTLAAETQTLYAVYADGEGGGNFTITKTMSEIVSDNGYTVSSGNTATCYTSLTLDENITLSTTGSANCGSFWSDPREWRLYQNKSGNAIVTATNGCSLTSVNFTFTYSNTGTLLNNGASMTSGTAVSASGTSATYTIGNSGSATNGQIRITAIEVSYSKEGEYSNYSTACTAAPKAEVNPTAVSATAAGANDKVEVTYENVNTESVAVALFNDEACTEAFTAGWLTAAFDADKNITYTVTENATYAERKAYIKLTAPETTGATEPAVVVIPVTQAAKDKVFASLEELVAAITPTTEGVEVTVTLTNEVIQDFYTSGSFTNGIALNVPYEGGVKVIEIYCKDVPAEWVKGGKVSGTITCPWKLYNSTWELCPDAWTELTYTAPAIVKSIAVSGTPTKTTYVDGEAFDPTGLVVTATLTDDSTEPIDVALVDWTFDPATLLKGQTSVDVTATYNSVSSAAYEVTGLIVNDIPTKTVAEFIAAGGTRCYLEGIVSNITNTTYGNFDLTDASGKIYVYGCLNAAGESQKFADLGVKNGDKIKVIADEYELYGGTKDEAKNVQYVSHISAATITIADITMELEEVTTISATVEPAEAEVTYSIKSGSEYISLVGNVITAVAAGTATITATVAEGATYMGNSVDFTVTVNPQNIAVLPFAFDGKCADIATTAGMSQEGIDVDDYASSPHLKINTTGDYLTIHFDSEPGALSYTIKANVNSGDFTGGFDVQVSENGDDYDVLVSYTELEKTAAQKTHKLDKNVRYVKFVYTNKVSGQNVALGNILISKLSVLRADLYDGKWGTFCPDQKVTYMQGASFYTLTYLEMKDGMPYKLFFDEITTDYLEAGKPYLFIAEGEEIKGVKSGEVVSIASNYNGFYGNVSGNTISLTTTQTEYVADGDVVNNYGVINSRFTLLGDGTNVAHERAHVQIKNGQLDCPNPPASLPALAPGARRVVAGATGINTATGVDQVQGDNVPTKMIINGQLFILRGEKMYDAQGKLVK